MSDRPVEHDGLTVVAPFPEYLVRIGPLILFYMIKGSELN